MYIRYGFLPQLEAARNTAAYLQLENTGNVLVILWEFLYILGLNGLITVLTYQIYVWKRMTERTSGSDFPFLIIVNGFLYFATFLCLIIQLASSYTNLLWINVNLFIFCLYAIITAVVLMIYATKVSNLIPSTNDNDTLMFLKKILTAAQIGGYITGAVLVFRSLTTLVDTIVYQYIPNGTIGQVIWNIIFKYVFWVVPELLIAVFASFSVIKTDDFITEMAIIDFEQSRGKRDRINTLADKERGFDIEKLAEEEERNKKSQGSVTTNNYTTLETNVELKNEPSILDDPKPQTFEERIEITTEHKVGEVEDDSNDPNAPLINKN